MMSPSTDGRYHGEAQAIRVSDISFSATPTGPVDTDNAKYVGRSQKILSTDDAPAQFNSITMDDPSLNAPAYRGRGQAIHVFGERHILPPDYDPTSCDCEDYGYGSVDFSAELGGFIVDYIELPATVSGSADGLTIYIRDWLHSAVDLHAPYDGMNVQHILGRMILPADLPDGGLTGMVFGFYSATYGPDAGQAYSEAAINVNFNGGVWEFTLYAGNTVGSVVHDLVGGDWVNFHIWISGNNISMRAWPDSASEEGATWGASSSDPMANDFGEVLGVKIRSRSYLIPYGEANYVTQRVSFLAIEPSDGCAECEDPDTGEQMPPFTPGYLPIFRRQIGDPKTTLDAYLCTMESGAMALDWHTRSAVQVWGGDLVQHCGRSESSIIGSGTNLSDLQVAWLYYGKRLDVRSGQTWADLIACLVEGRAVVLQGDYGFLPDSEKCQVSFEGNHAIVLLPYKIADRILTGDPLCTVFKGRKESSLRAYAEAFGAAVFGAQSPQPILFAVSRPWIP